jgi:rod shape-determining protein MreC
MHVLFSRKKFHVMAGRNSHFSNSSVFFTFLIAGLALFLLPQHITSKISLSFYDIFEPILQSERDTQTNTLDPRSDSDETISYREYARLWKTFQNQRAQLLALHEEHERLAKVRTGLPQSFCGVKLARITGNVSNYSHEVVINEGHDALIRPGQYVLSEKGDALIGVVSETAEAVARVRLITDSKQSLEVRIRRQGTQKDIGAIMVGNGTNSCRISMIDRQQDVREGDTVFAASVPNKLDVPVVVGEVVRVAEDEHHPLLWDITVMPAEDMTQLNNVAVIIADETLLKWTE